jgi:hypothetical protein
MKFTSGTM